MNKKVITLITAVLVLGTGLVAVNAANNNYTVEKKSKLIPEKTITEVQEKDKAKIDEKEAINLANNYKNLIGKGEDNITTMSIQNSNTNERKIKLKQEHITEESVTYWEVSDNESKVKLNSKTGELISIMNKKEKFTESNHTEEEVKKIAKELYKTLGINKEYELYFIEKFDDELWTAYFAKKVNGIYNNFQSVRVTFAPADNEVVYLVVKDEECDDNEVVIQKKEAEQIAIEIIKADQKAKCDTELTFMRANNFFTEENFAEYQKSNIIRKCWIVTVNEKYIVYVDCTNGEVIGGDYYE